MRTIGLAEESELDGIWTLVSQAIQRMRGQGNPQWGMDYPTRALYAGDIARGELYALRSGGKVLGVACINTDQSPEYAAIPWQIPGPALSFHRMAVDPAAQGQGVARALFAFSEALARERALPALHLDTYSRNYRMQAILLRLGFAKKGEIHLHGRPLPYPCYEKVLADLDGRPFSEQVSNDLILA